MSTLAEAFCVMGNAQRLKLLRLLTDGEKNVGTMREDLKTPHSTVSHHLGVLRGIRLVKTRRDGLRIFYSMGDVVTFSPKRPDAFEVACDEGSVRMSWRT